MWHKKIQTPRDRWYHLWCPSYTCLQTAHANASAHTHVCIKAQRNRQETIGLLQEREMLPGVVLRRVLLRIHDTGAYKSLNTKGSSAYYVGQLNQILWNVVD